MGESLRYEDMVRLKQRAYQHSAGEAESRLSEMMDSWVAPPDRPPNPADLPSVKSDLSIGQLQEPGVVAPSELADIPVASATMSSTKVPSRPKATLLKDEYIHGEYAIPARGPELTPTQIKYSDDSYFVKKRNEWRAEAPDMSEDEIASMAHADVQNRVKNREAVGWMKHGVNRVKLEKSLHGQGGPIEIDILKNPTETEYTRWSGKHFKGREEPEVRVITDVEGNVYVWDAEEALHHDVIKGTGMRYDWEDDWTDVDGIELDDLFNQLVLGGIYEKAYR